MAAPVDELACREAYRRAVHDLLAAFSTHLSGPNVRDLLAWQRELEEWKGGDPPPPPQCWTGPYLLR